MDRCATNTMVGVADLYQRALELVGAEVEPKRAKVYTPALVMWLMIWQRLQSGASQQLAVKTFEHGFGERFAGTSRKVRAHKFSTNTAAYNQARIALKLEIVEQVFDKLFSLLLDDSRQWQGREVYLVDGAVVRLSPTEELREAYPPASNGRVSSNFPQMLLVVAQNLMTGVALRPAWGPKQGREATSEQALTAELCSRLAERSVVVGDRNFGCFSVLFQATKNNHDVVVRLRKAQARKVFSGDLPRNGTDQRMQWNVSRHDRVTNREIPENAFISGRLIAIDLRPGGKKKERFYFFTTLFEIPAQEIVELYARRWIVEGDIRDLKKTLSLNDLSGKSVNIVAKEILLGFVAYNLVRAVNISAGMEHRIDPRRISFKSTLDLIRIYSHELLSAPSIEQFLRSYKHFLLQVARYQNPIRKRPSYPRRVHKKPQRYLPRHLAPLHTN